MAVSTARGTGVRKEERTDGARSCAVERGTIRRVERELTDVRATRAISVVAQAEGTGGLVALGALGGVGEREAGACSRAAGLGLALRVRLREAVGRGDARWCIQARSGSGLNLARRIRLREAVAWLSGNDGWKARRRIEGAKRWGVGGSATVRFAYGVGDGRGRTEQARSGRTEKRTACGSPGGWECELAAGLSTILGLGRSCGDIFLKEKFHSGVTLRLERLGCRVVK
jgi:hypothetical protein